MDRPQNLFQKALGLCLVVGGCSGAPNPPHPYEKAVTGPYEHVILLPTCESLKDSHSPPSHNNLGARSNHELDQLDQSIFSCLSKAP